MADTFTRRKRSAVMSAIRSQGNAATELRLIALFRAHTVTPVGGEERRPSGKLQV